MEIDAAASAFSALGHPGRLRLFRLLMRFAPRGVRPTEMAEALAMPPSTLSHHLAELDRTGLLRCERRGRSLFYAADLAAAERLIGYLALDCSRGRPDLVLPLLTTLTDRAPMSPPAFNVLFICSGNSARSIFAEALLRDIGGDRFRAHSAGTRPNTELNPFALEVLQRNGHSLEGLRSKHVSEFQEPGAPVMDFVFTVCDTAAAEECPPWPGQPITGHWGLPDPVKAQGTDAEKALVFAQTYGAMRRRIEAFVALPFETLDRLALQARVDRIGLEAEEQETR
ncbi:metalloregulator ArsR/SmtB family transcription factor [Rubellimicrobium sp. CFH 75288]|uniref:metalloregulator ArsR/SmtB family transcription factor n=1 Tax=Rubellimicrobium sp. CFH 75288 TaxID=2697034 RepID=UPI0014136497|nr:metalloregulator ArsR/SmtB family transcription factor [Rubellimicrobium sp. CFH 75288]NAZ36671.1 metalloregulator ArsR/SmtB family transcription factor [Rubellimicrobium sp. CFH 75288]